MLPNQKLLGAILTGLGIILILLLIFVKSDVDAKNVYLCEATEHNPELSMEDCPAHNSGGSWLIFLAFGVSFLVLGVGVLLTFLPIKSEKTEFKQVDVSKLDDEEKKVYDLLKQNEGSMYQSDIIKQADLYKVKATRILDKLEAKKIIDRKRRGMTNIIVLK